MNKERTLIQSIKKYIVPLIRWIGLSLFMGIPVGIIVGFFKQVLSLANQFRGDHPWLIYGLPLAGILISYLYVKAGRNAYTGENLLKSEVMQASKDIPIYMVPLIFFGSLLTTFFGGSAGKEAAGVAMGGTLADAIAHRFKLSEEEQRTLVVIGVGSGFGVLYDVPLAGAILGMELVLKGKFHYEALVPAFVSSVVANKVAYLLGDQAIVYPALDLGGFSLLLIVKLIGLGILFGVVSILFNMALDTAPKVYSQLIKNPVIKGIVGGCLTIVLFWIAGDNYNGLGQSFIAKSFEESVSLMEWIWKIIFTAVALGSVFQGGRGNPTFFVGATFGSAIAPYFNLGIPSVAALGMIGVFCGAASLPLTGIVMAIEYFGANEVMAIILVMTITYMISGFYDLFSTNKLAKGKKELFEAQIKS
ncbi:chloride channel protein [Turicibacter bilis]|uniref:chloride channel protein n=1 Tax=Turicibacter bilis TaxID=2735723 RepID=UPI002114B6AF|nr:chloride channel protein [Turicibacter bilis]